MTDLEKLKKTFDEIAVPYREFVSDNAIQIEIYGHSFLDSAVDFVFDKETQEFSELI